MRTGPRIYNFSPAAAGSIEGWSAQLRTAKEMNFDTVWVSAFYASGVSGHIHSVKNHRALASYFRPSQARASKVHDQQTALTVEQGDDAALIGRFVQDASTLGLNVMIDLVASHTSLDAELRSQHPEWYAVDGLGSPRPISKALERDSAAFDWTGDAQLEIAAYFESILTYYLELGIRGFCCVDALDVPAVIWRRLIAAAKFKIPAAFFCADILGRPSEEILSLKDVGFDYLFNSVKWWDGRSPWFAESQRQLHEIAPTIGFPEAWNGVRLIEELGLTSEDIDRVGQAYRSRYALAAALSNGIVMPMGYETAASEQLPISSGSLHLATPGSIDNVSFIAAINWLGETVPALAETGPFLVLGGAGDMVQAFARWTPDRSDIALIVLNTDGSNGYTISLDWLLSGIEEIVDLEDLTPTASTGPLLPFLKLEPYELRIYRGHLLRESIEADSPLNKAAAPSRIVIEDPAPCVDNSRFPAKRIVGDLLQVTADIYRDGHDQLSAAIRLREAGQTIWRVAMMRFFDNDRWQGSIPLKWEGQAHYTIESWTDHFGSWVAEVRKKRAAGQVISLELIEGRELLVHTIERAKSVSDQSARGLMRLEALLRHTDGFTEDSSKADILLSLFSVHAVAAFPDKADRLIYEPATKLLVERQQARYASWYEMFPRSQGIVPDKAASFADCTKRLPEIRDLGFHVVYLVPIHPIGKTNRKGRDNSLIAGPGDPGSPYAIGSEFGGHDAIDPELGTIEEFRLFQQAVRDHGMELAMDFAIQCSPDHPWLKQHPSWFRHRPDGSIKFAENPPKKYEDIVNIDFDSPDWREIWDALRDILLFWVAEGVKIFRVDNPHTKPVPFWQWVIAEVKAKDPDVLFLAEAFTRPKMMRRLAKVGFTQSYSYFTWRNTKVELTEYLTELTTGLSRDYYQPNFFVNTPDILPEYLQVSGRPGFRIRLVLAATLSPVYGIYNGFELCEAAAVAGKEDYAHSEKYQYKIWDWDRPGHIKDDIRLLNRLRETSPALKLFTNLLIHDSSHPEVIFYSKISSPETTGGPADEVFIAVNLNPFATATSEIAFPLERLGLDEAGSFETEESFTGERRRWHGRRHTITLDPARYPAMVLRRIQR